jgi:uncharacterized membrane protein YfcA
VPSSKAILLVVLGLVTAGFLLFWIGQIRRAQRDGGQDAATDARPPTPLQLAIGAVTDFFDTLGIGSFAKTTSLFRLFNVVDDRVIPGTLNVGHTLPAIAEAFIYITIVKVEFTTLVSMIAAAVLGAWLGAGIVARWDRRKVQIGMGVALLVAAAFFLQKALGQKIGGGGAEGLAGELLVASIAGNFVLGALMTLGIGLFAPCMVLVSLLGMNDATAFPIMMGSCAFLMPFAGVRFIRARSYALRPALGLAIGGLPAVFLAAYVFASLPVHQIRWLVIVVVLYTAITMLYSALERPRG